MFFSHLMQAEISDSYSSVLKAIGSVRVQEQDMFVNINIKGVILKSLYCSHFQVHLYPLIEVSLIWFALSKICGLPQLK